MGISAACIAGAAFGAIAPQVASESELTARRGFECLRLNRSRGGGRRYRIP